MIDCDDLLQCIPSGINKICVAISGGADSLCLTLLLHEISSKCDDLEISACFVDHKLRRESSIEILSIIDILKKHNITNDVVVWEHGTISGNIQFKARKNRYRLLLDHCIRNNIQCLATGHHIGDQWETFFMRLARGSGLSGLSCINPVSRNCGILLWRPLLSYTRQEIEATLLDRYGIGNDDFVHDPSNLNQKYERVMWRYRYEDMSRYCLTYRSIASSIQRLQKANLYIEGMVSITFNSIFYKHLCAIHLNDFRREDIEIQRRVMQMVLRFYGHDGNFSYVLLESICTRICDNCFKSVNICGFILMNVGEFLVIRREVRNT